MAELREIAVLGSVGATLGWDQEVMMPPAAAALRGEQAALLSALAHERRTAPALGELLARCEADAEIMADPDAGANLRNLRHDYDRLTKLPTELVREMAETSALGMHAWREHREANNFAGFAP
ncbi:MAG TPA: hypothetical protein VM759_00240, partial [Longimicrobium sp.]|nr:hypothetical protein [Longimicrobium sp.]